MSWRITLGYNSQSQCEEQAWTTLKECAREIASDPRRIEHEASRVDPSRCGEDGCRIEGYAENYAEPFQIEIGGPGQGHPITIVEKEEAIIQWASTGCDVKYTIRRAFIRLLLEAAHRRRIEISISVG